MKKFFSALFLLCTAAFTAKAQGWDASLYKQIESRIHPPEFRNKTYDITKYGASIGAGAADNQTAINKAIEACSKDGGGKVVVEGGTFLTGAIRMQSGVNLEIKKGACILFAFDPALYPLVRTHWEGLDLMNYSPCIYAYQAKDIAISGEGTIDGNGSNETWWQWRGSANYGYAPGRTAQAQTMPFLDAQAAVDMESATEQERERYKRLESCAKDATGRKLSNRDTLLKMSDEGLPVEERVFGNGHGMRPPLVNFYECENVLIEDVTMLRSPFWVITPTLSKNITVRRVKIINNGPNGDGCNPESCEDVLIEDCFFHTGDDCIAVKSGRNADGRRTNRPSKNIIIRGCSMEDGHGGVVIGSEVSAGVMNVFAENCKMDSPNLERILRIKTNTCRGGVIEGIFMRHITAGQCKEAVLRINLVYEPNELSKRGFLPTVRNVYMEDVTCRKSKYGILLNGLEEADSVYNIHVKDCTFDGVSGEKIRMTGKSHDIRFDNLRINGEMVRQGKTE